MAASASEFTAYAPDRSPSLLTADQAADVLNVCVATVRRLGWRGELPEVRIGRSVRYPVVAVAAMTLGNTTRPPETGASAKTGMAVPGNELYPG